MTGVTGDWRSGVTCLDDMVRHRSEFLGNPGSVVDHEEIANLLGEGFEDRDEAALEVALFDHVVELFGDGGPITLHRHLTVPDFDAYVFGLEDGSADTGAHWSLAPDIESPCPEMEDVHLMMTARVAQDQVDWVGTFQALFSHPWEREVFVTGSVNLVSVTNLHTGETHDPQASSYPSFCP